MKAAKVSIKVLLDQPSKEMAALIKEAQTEHKGLYSFLYLSISLSLTILSSYSSSHSEYLF